MSYPMRLEENELSDERDIKIIVKRGHYDKACQAI
jgi:hypothetical protein